MLPSPLRIEPIPGYTPTIGRLVGMLTYARSTTVAAVEGLTLAELDHLHDAQSNSIGALLAHIVVVERSYQVMTFEDRPLSPDENAQWSIALKLGAEGRRALRGRSLEHYLDELRSVRHLTLEGLAARDDAWLERSVNPAPRSTCIGRGFMSPKMKSIIADRFVGCERACRVDAGATMSANARRPGARRRSLVCQ